MNPENLLNNYVGRLNKALETLKDNNLMDELNNITSEMFKNIEHSGLYFSRSTYIAFMTRPDTGKAIKQDLLKRPEQYEFQVNDDIEEHPGVVICFKNE